MSEFLFSDYLNYYFSLVGPIIKIYQNNLSKNQVFKLDKNEKISLN